MFFAKLTLSSSDIIASIALIASAIGLVLSYITMKHQRQHNIKSVMPILHIDVWDYEDCIAVSLKNCGLGVALVKEITTTHKNESSIKNCLYAWLPKKLGAMVNYSHYWITNKDFVIEAGACINLVRIPIDDSKADQIAVRESLREQIGYLTVHIEYDDIYGNPMTVKRKELTFFHRKDNMNRTVVLNT